jgi:hypothetical protein
VRNVTFEAEDGPIHDRIDDAYRAKYRGSPYLEPMIGAWARSATVRVLPRGRRMAHLNLAHVLASALFPVLLVGDSAPWSGATATQAQSATTMKIRMDVNGTIVTATLDDNASSRDFVALLPLTVTLEDYNATEKISNLPKKLSTKDAPEGVDPAVGDVAYYAPWGNLAIFYKDFGYSRGLVKLGRLDSRADVLTRPGKLRVTIARSEG